MNVETKVKASSGTAAAVLLVMYLLDQWSFVAAMPGAVHLALQVLVGTALVFAAGYLAKHTPRAATGGLIKPSAPPAAPPATAPDAGHVDLVVTIVVAAAVAVLTVVLLH